MQWPTTRARSVDIEISRLQKRFRNARRDEIPVLDDVTFSIPRGRVTAIVGPNGAGKTTLLHILAGLITPDSGSIAVYENDKASKSRLRVGMVFQDYAESLLPWRTNIDNVALPLEVDGIARTRREEITRSRLLAWASAGDAGAGEGSDALDQVGIPRDGYPYALSGGQQQWLAMLRAFVNEPELVLLDEPFAALDPHHRILAQQRLAKLQERLGAAMLVVSHGLDEAAFLADRVLVLSRRPASVVATIEIDLPRPRPPIEELVAMDRWSAIRRELETQFLRTLHS